jgi:tripartite-type tricarboxylate transporter receptor subunit TctC
MFVTLSSAITFVKAGRIRMLGVVAPNRLAALPEAPTMVEQGFPGMSTGSWQGVFVPKGTRQAVIDRLYAATHKTMADAEVVKRLSAGGVDVVLSRSPKEFGDFVKAETARFADVVKEAGISAE